MTGLHSFGEMTAAAFVESLADKTPTPGGGAVAAVTLSHAAALGRMTLAYTLGRARFADSAEVHAAIDARLAAATESFMRLADADADGYGHLNAMQRLPQDHPQRASSVGAAVDGAIEPPLQMARLGAAVAEDLLALVGTINPWLASDLAIAGDLAGAGTRAALRNVTINLPLVADSHRRELLTTEAALLRDRATAAAARCEATAVADSAEPQ